MPNDDNGFLFVAFQNPQDRPDISYTFIWFSHLLPESIDNDFIVDEDSFNDTPVSFSIDSNNPYYKWRWTLELYDLLEEVMGR